MTRAAASTSNARESSAVRPRGRLVSALLAVAAGLVDPLVGVFSQTIGIFLPRGVPARADSPRRRRRGLALVLGGIEGPSRYNRAMALGLLKSGYRGAVARVDWNAGVPLLRCLVNLMSRAHHEREADRLRAIIERHRRDHPCSPVHLLAQSGGCWIVVKALEALPADARVDTAVLIAPSISPGCDLCTAASRCSGGIISIGSPGDFWFLGLGTIVLGSSDRVHGPSAGLVGWRRTPAPLRAVRWRPAWLRYGYLGNHTTSAAMRFIQHVVAPQLRGQPALP